MNKADWIELAKIVGGILTGLAGVATVAWQIWRVVVRKIERLRQKNRDLESQVQRLETERTAHRERVEWYKAQYEGLKSEHAAARAQWKTKFEASFTKRHTEYLADVKKRQTAAEALSTSLREANSRGEEQKRLVAEIKAQLAAADAALEQKILELAKERHAIEHHLATVDALSHQLHDAQSQIAHLDAALAAMDLERNQLRDDLSAAEAKLNELDERFKSVLRFDGRLWNLPLAPGIAVPEFRPAANRKMPIISILNFKGGVGKTSLTVNLAGYLGQQGKRPLMIDLDYQRSLSQLVLTDKDRNAIRDQGLCLQHFLTGADHGTQRFLKFAHRIEKGMDGCRILPNSNAGEFHDRAASLDEAENQIMAEWIVNRDRSADVRFRLREALHGLGVESHFDYVLLDCPPRLSLSTVNALAASDFVLVPILLDDLSANCVAPLVTALREFRDLFPNLKLLGVVANRSRLRNGKPIVKQNDTWDKLKKECAALYKDFPVRFFKTVIPENKAFGAACVESGPALAIGDPTIYKVFQKLNDEIEGDIHAHSHS